MKPFSTLLLSKTFLKNLNDLKYKTMTPIQEMSIPPILNGRDILAQAKTGSGKTAAFGIGILNNIDIDRYRIQALVVCPTRELAEQVTSEMRRIARFRHNIKILKITGGFPVRKQEHSLSHQAHIVIGTPGRIMHLLDRETLILDEVKMVVLDEADRMLDMGFIDTITDIISFTPKSRQTLCFSATFPDNIRALGRKILNNPKEITVETRHKPETISHSFYEVTYGEKLVALTTLLNREQPESTLIFCNTKDVCREVEDHLNHLDFQVLAIHGDLEQKERTEVLIRFENGSSKILVATDVAARGLDIKNLGAVINFDLPFETETYIHRIGRTGRAGKEGHAFSLISPREDFRLKSINEFMESDYPTQILDTKEIESDSEWSEPEMVTLSINGGRRNKISAGDILGALTSKNGVKGEDVGKIDRLDYITFVAVKRKSVERAFRLLSREPIKGRRFKAMIHHV